MTHRVLCRLDEIPDGQGRGFVLEDGDGNKDEVFVIRRGRRLFAYRNACPHQGSPLDWARDRFLTEDGRHIECQTHGALFEIETGDCIAGPCAGDALDGLSVTLDADDRITLG